MFCSSELFFGRFLLQIERRRRYLIGEEDYIRDYELMGEKDYKKIHIFILKIDNMIMYYSRRVSYYTNKD
jgi:hypothetical protein